jgi:formylglycine-generating enzyme required for sulfatase activity
MGKVAIVGVEGSGKTVLMAGLCECFKQVPGSDEPYLMPENQAAFKFMETVPYMLRVKRQWPAATSIDNLRAMSWTYRFGNEVLETVEMLDYPGELYRLAFGESEEVSKSEVEAKRDEIKKFLDHLIDADTILVLLDLSDVMNLGENHKNLETVWITRGILSYAKKLKNVKHTVLVFTQADRYARELAETGGPERLYADRLPMLKTLFPKQEVMAVAVVDGTDASGLPIGGYRKQDCEFIMRCILAEQEKTFRECLSRCEKNMAEIEQFKSGNPLEFYALVESFSVHVTGLVQAAKPFNKTYGNQVNVHQRDARRLCDLVRDLKQLVENMNTETLAKSGAWRGLETKYSDVDMLFVHFQRYFQEKNNKQIETTIKEKKSFLIVLAVFGMVITLLIGFSIKMSRDAERDRLRKVEVERIEAEQKRENENRAKQAEIEAKVKRERLELEKKQEDERRVKAKKAERAKIEASLKPGDQTTVSLGNGVSLDLVWCPAGSFVMGSPEDEKGRRDEEIQHRVTLTKGFWMGRTEVTQAQWKEIIGSNPSYYKGDDLPVEKVSWYNCQNFISKLNKKFEANDSKLGFFRLPTEAEWEYACRAGTTGPYAVSIDEILWYGFLTKEKIHAVAQKRPNPWGLYDMHGNVLEWCQDTYGKYAAGSVTDPVVADVGSYRVSRGGYLSISSLDKCRSACRGFSGPSSTCIEFGFRVVMDLP